MNANFSENEMLSANMPLCVGVMGAGYVGLVTAACLAELGHQVTCMDIDPAKIESLRSGAMPIYEPGLAELVAKHCFAGRLEFALELPRDAEIVFLAVGTPPQAGGAGADLHYLFAAAEYVARTACRPMTVVIKSTVPPGTADAVERVLSGIRPELELAVASNPEFLREGSGIADFLCPDRIVCGTQTLAAQLMLGRLYRPLVDRGSAILFTERRAAELIKHASNAFLSIKISFINEVADLCEAVGASIDEVSAGVGMDRRIGPAFLKAGPGYGGSCFPKDAAALVATARSNGLRMHSVETASSVNVLRQQTMVKRIIAATGGAEGRTVAVLGLAFKANTDDMRDSPALSIIEGLLLRGVKVRAYDPQALPQARLLLHGVSFCDTAYACVESADCIVVMTEWQEFLALDIPSLMRATYARTVVDMRNLLDREMWTGHGFTVHGIGRPVAAPRQNTSGKLSQLHKLAPAVVQMRGAP